MSEEPNGPAESDDPDRPDETTERPTDSPPEPMSDTDSTPSDEQSTGRDIERYVRYVVLAGFTLLALVALLRFYFAASATIDTWVTAEYRSMFQAAFNLVVLLLAGIGISWQVRALA